MVSPHCLLVCPQAIVGTLFLLLFVNVSRLIALATSPAQVVVGFAVPRLLLGSRAIVLREEVRRRQAHFDDHGKGKQASPGHPRVPFYTFVMESESPPDGARRKGERGEGGQASWSLGGRQQQQQRQQRAGAEAGAPSPPRPPASGMLYSTLFFLVVVIFGTMMEATNSFVLGSRGNGRGGNNPSSLQLPRTSELQRRMTFLSPSLIAHRQSTVRSSRSSTALAAFKRLPLGAGVSVSLDKPSLPKGIRPGAGQAPHFVWVLAGVTLALLLLGKLPGVGLVNGAVRDFCERNNLDIYDKLAYRLRYAPASLCASVGVSGRMVEYVS